MYIVLNYCLGAGVIEHGKLTSLITTTSRPIFVLHEGITVVAVARWPGLLARLAELIV